MYLGCNKSKNKNPFLGNSWKNQCLLRLVLICRCSSLLLHVYKIFYTVGLDVQSTYTPFYTGTKRIARFSRGEVSGPYRIIKRESPQSGSSEYDISPDVSHVQGLHKFHLIYMT